MKPVLNLGHRKTKTSNKRYKGRLFKNRFLERPSREFFLRNVFSNVLMTFLNSFENILEDFGLRVRTLPVHLSTKFKLGSQKAVPGDGKFREGWVASDLPRWTNSFSKMTQLCRASQTVYSCDSVLGRLRPKLSSGPLRHSSAGFNLFPIKPDFWNAISSEMWRVGKLCLEQQNILQKNF